MADPSTMTETSIVIVTSIVIDAPTTTEAPTTTDAPAITGPPKNTYGWRSVDVWDSADTTITTKLFFTEPPELGPIYMTLVMFPHQYGISLPPDLQTMTKADKTYRVSGCEFSLATDRTVIAFRRDPFGQGVYETSAVETTTQSTPVEISAPSSTNVGESQTTSATDATTDSEASGSEGSASAIQSDSGTQYTTAAADTNTRSQELSGGAIAGIAIGGIVILALIIGGWYFWRRRRRIQSTTSKNTHEADERAEQDDEKSLPDPQYDASTFGARQEMSGDSRAQELSRSQSHRYIAHEIGSDDIPGELPLAGVTEATDEGEVEIPVPANDNTASHTSPHIEAQRRRELEWLKMEEERIRKRQETLLMQGGGKVDGSREAE